MSKTTIELPQDLIKTLGVAAAAFLILTAAVVVAYRHAKGRPGTIVLPGGVTYLGPSPTPIAATPTLPEKIPIPADDQWSQHRGQIFPYSFSYPKSLSLGVFPGDPFDSVTIFWGNTNPQDNLLLRVEDLNQIPNMKRYIGKSKKDYVHNWWRQYNYKGVSSVGEFTNSKGLMGYRAKFTDAPADNIFFEVPGRTELVIWLTDKLLPEDVFNHIVDSVEWGL